MRSFGGIPKRMIEIEFKRYIGRYTRSLTRQVCTEACKIQCQRLRRVIQDETFIRRGKLRSPAVAKMFYFWSR